MYRGASTQACGIIWGLLEVESKDQAFVLQRNYKGV